MEGEDLAALGRRLAAARRPGTGGEPARCGLCGCRVADAGEEAVEVALDSAPEEPDAWLCGGCYEHLVEDLNVAPLRVFKSGPRRSVVLPVPPDAGREPGE